MQINDPKKTTFEEDIKHKNHVLLQEFIHRISLKALHIKKEILPFVTPYQPSVSDMKDFLMTKDQPFLHPIYKERPPVSFPHFP